MSICKSEILFSPVKETPMPGAHFSVDSLDCDLHDMMLTCQANKDNYTIAFEGSTTMYSEDSDYHDTDKSSSNSNPPNQSGSLNLQPSKNLGKAMLEDSMTQSDSSSFTTWSKLKKRNSDDQLRRPSGNNNNSEDESSHLALSDTALKSQSMPNLHKQRLRRCIVDDNSLSNSSSPTTIKQRPVKLFNIHHQHIQSSSGSGSLSEMATSVDANGDGANNKHPNFNLVKLFMKQKSISQEGMSLTMDQLSSTENWPASQSGESSSSDNKNADNLKNLELSAVNSSVRTYDLIAEEPEEISKSESIEQLSESVSKSESVCDSFDKDAEQKNANNNDSLKNYQRPKAISPKNVLKVKNELFDRSIQTSQFSEILNLKNATNSPAVGGGQPVKLIEASFLNKLKKEGEVQKPVYVLYPNYVLPNLDFLNEKNDVENVHFVPQSFPKQPTLNRKRPFSFNDIEGLKRKGFGHVKDWDSLNILLPQEYRKVLADVPEISSHIKPGMRDRPSFLRNKRRPLSCDVTQTNISSSSSTATQPSSGYRGSSSILSDSENSPAIQGNHNPLFVYRYDSVTSSEASLLNCDKQAQCITKTAPCTGQRIQEAISPRPPLPRSILGKAELQKRFSMYETSEEDLANDEVNVNKRRSVPEPYFLNRNKRLSENEDEGVYAGTSSSSMDEKDNIPSRPEYVLPHMSTDELIQLEEYLKLSGLSTSDEERTEESLSNLRSYVSKFLTLKINQDDSEHFGGKKSVSFAEKLNVNQRYLDAKQCITHPPNNSPNVSVVLLQRNFQPKAVTDMTICEENENSPNYSSPQATPIHLCKTASDNYVQKRSLINGVLDAVEQVMKYFSPASNQQELNALGDSSVNPASAKLALSTLCPALYAVLSDGLKPCLETSFGAINNSVWQVVEASSQQGPLTKALNDLVMRINSEDVISEGLVKFNAFIFGLLNVRSLDAWTSYLRTRESVLKKHYTADSVLVLSLTGGTNLRTMLDSMVAALQPLAFLPFQFDLLFEYKQLHLSFKRMDSYHQPTSPILKYSPSTTYKQFLSAKYGQVSSNSRSNSESDDISTGTVRNGLQGLSEPLHSNEAKLRKSDKERPRSCVDPGMFNAPTFKLGEDVNNVAKKRWSNIATNSKLYQAYDRLAKEDEEYADSLESPQMQPPLSIVAEKPFKTEHPEPESLDSNYSDKKPVNGRRFKKLQQRWEMLSAKDSFEKDSPPPSPTHPNVKSKIPRPITSPVRPSGIPVLISPPAKPALKKTPSAQVGPVKATPIKNVSAKKIGPRTSRADQVESNHNVQRPSSLPYKPASQASKTPKIVPQRRAASSSLSRRVVTGRNIPPKSVRTLSHRLPSESGHLSYNEGEILKVVLEVDDKWLLCCRGTRKGLVPKSAVIADNERF
uniref:Iporin n=1 Tax=Dendroctonus ponderosae TaxID=77166 RepID=A0AAR5Q0I9_DENPD